MKTNLFYISLFVLFTGSCVSNKVPSQVTSSNGINIPKSPQILTFVMKVSKTSTQDLNTEIYQQITGKGTLKNKSFSNYRLTANTLTFEAYNAKGDIVQILHMENPLIKDYEVTDDHDHGHLSKTRIELDEEYISFKIQESKKPKSIKVYTYKSKTKQLTNSYNL